MMFRVRSIKVGAAKSSCHSKRVSRVKTLDGLGDYEGFDLERFKGLALPGPRIHRMSYFCFGCILHWAN